MNVKLNNCCAICVSLHSGFLYIIMFEKNDHYKFTHISQTNIKCYCLFSKYVLIAQTFYLKWYHTLMNSE